MLTACGIETLHQSLRQQQLYSSVATVLTACGIETLPWHFSTLRQPMLQQCLPLAVLKQPKIKKGECPVAFNVATVLTACGIETLFRRQFGLGVQLPVATVLTACGIETGKKLPAPYLKFSIVATVLTACGIETFKDTMTKLTDIQLQQCLPLAVLKRISITF